MANEVVVPAGGVINYRGDPVQQVPIAAAVGNAFPAPAPAPDAPWSNWWLHAFPQCCKAGIVAGLYDIPAIMKALKPQAVEVGGVDLCPQPPNYQGNHGWYPKVWFAITASRTYGPKSTTMLAEGWAPIARVPTHEDYRFSSKAARSVLRAQKGWLGVLWMYPAPPKGEWIDI